MPGQPPPRRAYELGVAALGLVKERVPQSEICFFGTDELVPEPPYPHRNCGKLGQAELANLFAESEVGVVFSLSNPSFVPLENDGLWLCGSGNGERAMERGSYSWRERTVGCAKRAARLQGALLS